MRENRGNHGKNSSRSDSSSGNHSGDHSGNHSGDHSGSRNNRRRSGQRRPPVSKWIYVGALLLVLRLIELLMAAIHRPANSTSSLWQFEGNLGWVLMVFGIVRTLVLRGRARAKKEATDAAGLKGESETASELAKLPAPYQTFNRLYLFNRNHRQEFDHVVIGPNGVFHIETKNWSGEIEFSQSRFERSVPGSFDNPMEQMSRHDTLLKNLLRDNGIDVPVIGLLCFTNPHATVRSTGQRFRCVSLDNLCSVIRSYGSGPSHGQGHGVAGASQGNGLAGRSRGHGLASGGGRSESGSKLTPSEVRHISQTISEHSKRHIGTGV